MSYMFQNFMLAYHPLVSLQNTITIR